MGAPTPDPFGQLPSLQTNAPTPQVPAFKDNDTFIWLDGKPTPKGAAAMAREQMQALHHAALGLPYQGRWDEEEQEYVIEDPRFCGMTLGEVMVVKRALAAAEGDQDAYRDMADRTMGKPKQAVESVNLDMTYTDFLDMLAQADAGSSPLYNPSGGDVYDVEAEATTLYENLADEV